METIQERIICVDSHPGSGKTSWAIQEINKSSDEEKIIYITPFLDEVNRIIENCPNKKFTQPSSDENSKRNKRKHLLELIIAGECIVSTHALFCNIDNEIIEALHLHEYTLYLDEVFQTVEKYNLSNNSKDKAEVKKKQQKLKEDDDIENDIQTLLRKELIRINDDYSVSWIDENTLSAYDKIKNMADRNLLYCIDSKLLMWTFPIEVFRFRIFKQIYILTYQFNYQIQAYYYSYFDLKYEIYHALKNNDTNEFEIRKTSEYQNDESEWKKSIKNKINILENSKLNNIGSIYYNSRNQAYKSALSFSWYDDKFKNNIAMIFVIRRNMINYYVNILKSKTTSRLWTSFKEYSKMLSSKYVSEKAWIALNTRATNNYRNMTDLCYLINRYLDPAYEKFFIKKGIEVNQDKYAVSELIQWVWRAAIRDDKEINLYIPSQRMRELLIKFLNDEELIF